MASTYEKFCKPWQREPFLDFAPLTGKVASHPFEQLPLIADRARAMLLNRNEDEVVDAAYFIEDAVKHYFEYLREEILNQLFEEYPELRDCFDLDSRLEDVAWQISLGFFSDKVEFQMPEMPTREDINDFEILKDLRYSLLYYPDRMDNAQLHEFFAVLALRFIDDCMETISRFGIALELNSQEGEIADNHIEKTTKSFSVIAAQPFAYAIDCVNYAEHLQDLSRRNLIFDDELKTIREHAAERARNILSERARKGGLAKNAENHQIRDEIIKWYKNNHHEFKTQEEAAKAAIKLAPITEITALRHIRIAVKQLRAAGLKK